MKDGAVFGFRHAREAGNWLEAEELVDFMERFRKSPRVTITPWAVPATGRVIPGEAVRPKTAPRTLSMAEALLVRCEELVREMAIDDFRVRLRKACIRLAETYDFLDPFAGEFEFGDGTLDFRGEAGDAEIIEATVQLVVALGMDAGVSDRVHAVVRTWIGDHGSEIRALQVRIGEFAQFG